VLDTGQVGTIQSNSDVSGNQPSGVTPELRSKNGIFQSIELFVGAGGLALGLQRAGFVPVLAVDSDIRAFETIQANSNHAREYTAGWGAQHEDVHRLDYTNLASPDLLAAGAPCQPFSIGGHLRREDDERNLFPEVLRAVRALRPRAFILENVRGLLFPRAKPYFDYLLAQLRVPSRRLLPGEGRNEHAAALQAIPETEHEYFVDGRVFNAADFGLPQVRQRLIVVGIKRSESPWAWPAETHSKEALVSALWDDAYWDEHNVANQVRYQVQAGLPQRRDPLFQKERWRTLRDLTRELGPPHDGSGNDPAHVLVPGARVYRSHTGSHLDWPSKSVKAGVHGPPGGEHIVVMDDGSYRYLTVRECGALQGFPHDYVWPKYRSQAMRLLGNAVPVALAEAVGRQLAATLARKAD
jgi:DNA (cytosine-5)-methyltransferase 1